MEMYIGKNISYRPCKSWPVTVSCWSATTPPVRIQTQISWAANFPLLGHTRRPMPVVIHLETSVELSLVMHAHLFLEGVFCSLAKAVSSIKVYLQERPISFKHFKDAETWKQMRTSSRSVACHTPRKTGRPSRPTGRKRDFLFLFWHSDTGRKTWLVLIFWHSECKWGGRKWHGLRDLERWETRWTQMRTFTLSQIQIQIHEYISQIHYDYRLERKKTH